MLKRTLMILMVCAGVAGAQSYYQNRVGNFDFYSGPNGYSGTGVRVGNQYFFWDNYGTGSGERLGNNRFFQYNPYESFDDNDEDGE